MENDSIDAKVEKQGTGSSAQNVSMGAIRIPINSIRYDMRHKHRGQCLIFNHYTYDKQTKCSPRDGTHKDAEALTDCFNNLEFEVKQYNDLMVKEIRQELTKISSEDHSESDCIVVVVLSHGDDEFLWARDKKYSIEWLLDWFNGIHCPTLVGKPKIFIIQACRGQRLDPGVKLMSLGVDVVDAREPTYKIPSIADFLIYYSTAPGHYAFRNKEFGSFFIRALATVLNHYRFSDYDLYTLLTIVNQRVAFDYESFIPTNREYSNKKQIPCICSMLTRLVFFEPKAEELLNRLAMDLKSIEI